MCTRVVAQPSLSSLPVGGVSEMAGVGDGDVDLLVEDWLRLTTVSGLLAVVTTLSLGEQRILSLLVLGHLVGRVLPARLALAVCPAVSTLPRPAASHTQVRRVLGMLTIVCRA